VHGRALPHARVATIDDADGLDAVANYLAATMRAHRRKGLYGAFEAVEDVVVSSYDNFK
jgi:hypothetical protein